jgi:predicted PurR-regulated permease PerM
VRTAAIGGRLLVLAVLVWLLAGLAAKLTLLVVAVLVALLLAGAAEPAVRWAAARRMPRPVSAGVVIVLMLAALGGAGVGLGVRIADQLPELLTQFQKVASDLSQKFGVQVPWTGSDGSSGGSGGSSGGSGGAGAGQLLSVAGTAGEVLVGAFLTFALTFLFLTGGPAMWHWLLGKFGGRVCQDVDAAGRAAWTTVGGYVRGLTIVAIFDAVGIGVGLLLLGVPLALTLAALQFVASYIPTVGAFVAGIAAVVVAYSSGGLGTAAFVLGLVIVVQQIGNDVIEPYVMKNRLPLNAAMVLVAVTAGGLLWGVAGALLFVPLAAAAAAAAHEIWVRRGARPIAGG